VLGCKLYQITKEQKYLDKAKELYIWLIQYMQDPDDYLFYVNITPSLTIGKSNYTINSGQPMQAACLLYNKTGEQQYLTDAQQIARSAHRNGLLYMIQKNWKKNLSYQ
jgi:rhamnogalacturonyl hydrolase YesR